MIIRKYSFLLIAIILSTSVFAQSKRQLGKQLEASDEKVERLESEVSKMRTQLNNANESLNDALDNSATQLDANATLTSTNTDLLNRINSEKKRLSMANRQIDSLTRIVNLLQMDSDFITNPKSKKDSIIAVVQVFYAAEMWEDRLDYVLQPNEVKSAMASHYNNYPVRSIIKPGQVTFLEHDSKDSSLQKVGIGNNVVYLRKENNAYKMDWAASHGLNRTSSTGFKQYKNDEPKEFRVIASLSNTYLAPYASKKQNYWSVELSTIYPKETFNGYVLKDSEEGRAIHELLEGDKTQRIIVKMGKNQEDKTGNVTNITDFIQQDWSKKQ